MCQFSGKKSLAKRNSLSILFQFCGIVQECINKILWLTFLFSVVSALVVLPSPRYSLFETLDYRTLGTAQVPSFQL